MKLTIILLTIAIVQVSAKGLSQTVSFNGKNAPLQEVLSVVKKQTGFSIVYNVKLLDKANPVSLNVTDIPLNDFLQQVFKDQPLDYVVQNTSIFISLKTTEAGRNNIDNVLAVSPTPISGRVLDENNQPLAGATVTLKAGKVLGITNTEGVFSVNVSVGDVLVISSVGFESTDYKISSAIIASSNQSSTPGTKASLTITLKRNEGKLDEVVFKGYYTESKRLTTGSVAKVTAETMAKQPVSNPLQALIGRMPGVQIIQGTGVPGGDFTVQIRGLNSLKSGNEPLYLIDGVPFTSTSLSSFTLSSGITSGGNPLNSINLADIESIEILKDADATAIYGSRGANGVVLINTKKGKAGAMKVDINLSSGIGQVAHKMDLLNTKQYLQMRNEAFKNDNETPDIYSSPDLLIWDTNRYTNWQKELIGKTSHYNDAQVSLSGGNTNTQYVVGGTYHRETSVFPGNFVYDKVSGHLNLTQTSVDQKFKATFSSIYTVDNNELPQSDLTRDALTLSPNAPALYDANGNLNWEGSTWTNPLSVLNIGYNAKTDNFISNTSLSYNFTPDLQLKANMGYTKMEMKEFVSLPITATDPAYWPYVTGAALFNNNSIKTWIIEPQLNWKKKLGSSKIDILAGATFQQNITDGQTFIATGYTSDALLGSIAAAAKVTSMANYAQYRYNAFFARANYNLNEKYILNLTVRRDGSSRFGADKKFANFGALGAAWIFSKENFFQENLPYLSFGKIRSSYGTTGNDQIQDYQYMDTYSPTQYPYQGTPGLMPNRLLNPEYAWEVNKKIEVALDLGFLNDRLLLSAAYYRNRSSNQLLTYLLPWITGFGGFLKNQSATVQNTGIELELSSINFSNKTFKWTTNFNLTIPRNKLVSYPGLEKSSDNNIYEIGKSLNIVKTIHFTGVNPQTGINEFEDVDNNGEISVPEDYTSLKNTAQKFYGGLQNKIEYKNFQLDIFFQFVKQNGRNYLYAASFPEPGAMGNQPAIVLNRWQKPGDITNIQQFSQSYSSPAYMGYVYNVYYSSDNTVSDASFIRLKNVSLSYMLPLKWMQQAHIQSCRIFIQGQNLLTKTNFLGLDPENNLNVGRIPPLRTIVAGIQLTL